LTGGIITLAAEYGRHGYRRITALLWAAGWAVNVKRVERIWRQEGLKVPHRQPRKGRLWLNDGSCVRLRPERPNHVWSYDFVKGRTHDGRKLRMLNVIDEFTRECLVIRVARKLKSTDVIDVLTGLFILRGAPGHIRSDNGPEFIAKTVRQWIAAVGAEAAFIEPGSPWENRYCESCNGQLRDELLNGEIFHSLAEARVVIEGWRQRYNTVRPHSSLGYKPPAPSAKISPPERAQPTTQVTVDMADEPTMHQVSPRTTSWGQTSPGARKSLSDWRSCKGKRPPSQLTDSTLRTRRACAAARPGLNALARASAAARGVVASATQDVARPLPSRISLLSQAIQKLGMSPRSSAVASAAATPQSTGRRRAWRAMPMRSISRCSTRACASGVAWGSRSRSSRRA
jgi:transposase InsO family protein